MELSVALRVPFAPDGDLVVYDFGGQGPIVLLHHASGFCARVMRRLSQPLTQRFRVFAFDARGHGKSGKPRGGYAWQVFADDLARVIRAIAESPEGGPVHALVGHSLGGIAGWLMGLRHPELVSRMVLFDPVLISAEMAAAFAKRAPGDAPPAWLTTRLRQALFASRQDAIDHFRSQTLYANFDPEVLSDYAADGLRPRGDGQLELQCPPSVEASIYALGETAGAFDPPGLRLPALVFSAQGSRFAEPQRRAAALSSTVQLQSLPGGHLFPLEQPDRAARLALDFLA